MSDLLSHLGGAELSVYGFAFLVLLGRMSRNREQAARVLVGLARFPRGFLHELRGGTCEAPTDDCPAWALRAVSVASWGSFLAIVLGCAGALGSLGSFVARVSDQDALTHACPKVVLSGWETGGCSVDELSRARLETACAAHLRLAMDPDTPDFDFETRIADRWQEECTSHLAQVSR